MAIATTNVAAAERAKYNRRFFAMTLAASACLGGYGLLAPLGAGEWATMTQPSKLQIAEHQHDDIAVVTLSGEMTVDDGDLAFGRYVDQMVAAGRCKVIVDLSNVTYIDSAAVGMLVAKQKVLQQHGGAIRLAHLTAKSHHLFAILKLKLVFEIYEDVDAAIRSFAWRPR